MLHYQTIHPDTLALLRRIQSLDSFRGVRLVGGTALALQIGHRKSIDLDLFGDIDAPLDELVHELSTFSKVVPLSSSKLMRFFIVDGVKVDVVNYPYKWIDQPIVEDGIVLAGIKDIAAMKLSAVTNRGTKKDFIDVYFLLKTCSLELLFKWYLEKYEDAELFTVVKSLTFFDDAEMDPMPSMNEPTEWEEVKSTINRIVTNYV